MQAFSVIEVVNLFLYSLKPQLLILSTNSRETGEQSEERNHVPNALFHTFRLQMSPEITKLPFESQLP